MWAWNQAKEWLQPGRQERNLETEQSRLAQRKVLHSVGAYTIDTYISMCQVMNSPLLHLEAV